MLIEDLQNILNGFSDKHDLKQKAITSCMKAMNNSFNEDITAFGGFSIDEIRLEFVKQEFRFEHYFRETPYVKTRIGLYKKKENAVYIRNLEPIGYYELDTDLSGDSFDDWLIVDVEKNNEIEVVSDLKWLSELLNENYLKKDSIYYEYISYFAHVVILYQSKKYRDCQFFIKNAFEFLMNTSIKKDFEKYANKTKKYMKRIASYMYECGFIDNDMLAYFKELEILNQRKGKL